MALTLTQTAIASPRNERQLVEAVRAGDSRAFEALYARYRDRIFSFILGRVGDHGRAEDIAQEVFISALRRLQASDQEIAFKPWIYEIAKNACIDEFRRGTRTREVPLQDDDDSVPGSPAMLSAAPTPAAAAESKQQMSDLRGAFGGLSENQHRLLVMREFEGLSYDEIGEQLDMTRQMVESGLFRARRKLAEEYEELATGRRCRQVQLAIDAGNLVSAAALGIRDRRRFSRHLSHCQVCRHMALQAGVDESLVKPRSVAEKIAGLLPVGVWRWVARGGRATRAAQVLGGGADQATGSALSLGPAAAAGAALVIAGLGGGLVHREIASGHAGHSSGLAHAVRASARAPQHGSSALPPGSGGAGRPGISHTAASLGRLRGTSAGGSAGGGHSSSTTRRTGTAGTGTAGTGTAPTGTPAAGAAPGTKSPAPSTGGASGSSTGGPSGAAAGAGSAASSVSAATRQVTSGAGQVLSSATQQLTAGAGRTVSGVGSTVSGVGGTVSKAGGAVSALGGGVQKVGTTVSQVGGAVAGNNQNPVAQGVGGVVQTAGGAVQGVGGVVNQVGGVVQQVGAGVQQLGNGVQKAGSTAAGGGSGSPANQTPGGALAGVAQTAHGLLGN